MPPELQLNNYLFSLRHYRTCQHEDFKVSEEQPVHREGHRLLLQIFTLTSFNEAVSGFW